MGGKIDISHNKGSLLPIEGQQPKFAQLYIVDTENEVANRINSVRSSSDQTQLRSDIVEQLKLMLDTNNVLAQSFRMAKDKLLESHETNVRLKLIGKRGTDPNTYNLPNVSEIAALIVGDFDEALGQRDIIVETQSGQLKRINELHPSYLGLQYPLLFPYGEDGYREDMCYVNTHGEGGSKRKKVTVRDFLAYRFQDRDGENSIILRCGRLTHQIMVDGYTLMESGRLLYIRLNQKELRCEAYKGLTDALIRGKNDSARQGVRVVLPPSVTGGPRYMIQNYQDAMTICSWAGYPDLFITFTCNPKWPEIGRYLRQYGLQPEDRADIIRRVFKIKLDGLIKDLRENKVFGRVRAVIYTIEFQKRGLPHAHILLFLESQDKFPTASDIDRVISAEIPDCNEDPNYYKAVCNFMIHGPCGISNRNAPCMSKKGCKKYFPKEFVTATTFDERGFPIYKRSDKGRTIEKNGVLLDNRYVVPHNRYLLLKYGAHMNMEWCNQSRSIKYLFKYINKGNDRVTATFYNAPTDNSQLKNIDEIQMYCDCRYVSPCEAMWRIFAFNIHFRDPPVQRLSFHLPEEQSVFYSDKEPLASVVNKQKFCTTMFEAWFEANKKHPEGNTLTYPEFPQRFVWAQSRREWVPRSQGFMLGRPFYVPPGSGDNYYLRCLINIIRGAKCHKDLMVVDGVQYKSYKDACFALGLLDDDREYIDGIKEASVWASAKSLRSLFCTLLTENCMSDLLEVWNKCRIYLSDDIHYTRQKALHIPDLNLTEDQIRNFTLIEIELVLRRYGKSLKEFGTTPIPNFDANTSFQNRLVHDEMNFDRGNLQKELQELVPKLTKEQRVVYDVVLDSVYCLKGKTIFLYGYGGTGKTFVWKVLSAAIRSKGDIILNVASSGIASLLLPGGRTAHSRFKIPLIPNQNSTCSIKRGSDLAELIILSKLIIWDEAPMMHKYCFEALDRTLKDLMTSLDKSNSEKPFGGKTIIFGGDFRKILPVIPKGRRQDVVNATINSSYIWRYCEVLRLTKNMRLQSCDSSIAKNKELQTFAKWIANIGDGVIGDDIDGCSNIYIPDDMLVKYNRYDIGAIVATTYPDLLEKLHDPKYLQERAILAPTLDIVETVNNYLINQNIQESHTYYSSNSACKSDNSSNTFTDIQTPEFLNSIKCSGVPNHELILKVGTPVMLLRNIDPSNGLCNGTRLIVTKLGQHVIQGKVITGHNAGEHVLIPRLSMTPSDLKIPFKFQRRQFPVMVSYAMTINKSQGQSLSTVGLYLKRPVFCHGQLYVALSRVTNRQGLKILLCNDDVENDNQTVNVVYREVFQNL